MVQWLLERGARSNQDEHSQGMCDMKLYHTLIKDEAKKWTLVSH